jgi:hypothetical protein
MEERAYHLVVLDVREQTTVSSLRIADAAVRQIYRREFVAEGRTRILTFEPLSLFARRVQDADDDGVAPVAVFVEQLVEESPNLAIVLICGSPAAVNRQELDHVQRAMQDYYLSAPL